MYIFLLMYLVENYKEIQAAIPINTILYVHVRFL